MLEKGLPWRFHLLEARTAQLVIPRLPLRIALRFPERSAQFGPRPTPPSETAPSLQSLDLPHSLQEAGQLLGTPKFSW